MNKLRVFFFIFCSKLVNYFKLQDRDLWWQEMIKILPAYTFLLYFCVQIMGPLHLDSFCGENSAIIKETLVQMSLNRLNRSNSLAYQDCGHSVNLTDSELPRRTENQANFNVDISCQQMSTADLSKSTGARHHTSSNTNQSDACNNRKL